LALPDRPPPSRYSVVERGGRLVVIDRETGTTPPSAAERMAAHDRRMGHEPMRPPSRPPEAAASDLAPDGIERVTPPSVSPAASRVEGALAANERRQPWADGNHAARSAAPLRDVRPPRTQTGRKTVTTSKWWDAKGPRTITLGPKGQAELTGSFLALFFGLGVAAIIAAFFALPLLLVAAFLLARFGGHIVGPAGARIVDKAIATRD